MYFVTICAIKKQPLLGCIQDGRMMLSPYGNVVHHCWNEVPQHFPFVRLDRFVVMPDHFHGLLRLNAHPEIQGAQVCRDATCRVPTRRHFGARESGSLSSIIASFKAAVTRKVRAMVGKEIVVWQPRFHDRIVRNAAELEAIRRYIQQNPLQWSRDGKEDALDHLYSV